MGDARVEVSACQYRRTERHFAKYDLNRVLDVEQIELYYGDTPLLIGVHPLSIR
jgi:hypothetical protein